MSVNLSDNATDCYSLETTPQAAEILHTTVLSIIVVLSLLANGMVLLLVARYKRLRCRSVVVSLSVVAVDILLTVTYTVPILVTASLQRWPFENGGCVFFGGSSFQFLMTRWLIMALLCIDRFSTVRFPFSYKKYSKCTLIILTILAWLIPFLFSIPTYSDYGFGPAELRQNLPTCFLTCDSGKPTGRACQLFYLLYFTFVFSAGSFLPLGLYSWLYCKARRLRPTVLMLGHVTTQVASGTIVRRPIAEYQLPNREWKALVTFALIMVTVLVTGLPAYLLQLVRVIDLNTHCKIPIYIHYIIIEILVSASALDPLVIMRTKDFRTSIKLLFCGRMAHTEDISSNNNSPPHQLNHLVKPGLSQLVGNESQHSALSGAQDVDMDVDVVITDGCVPNGTLPLHQTLDHSPRTSVS